jgi:DNA integrity scanning protein DisA with diadenylate cyclase activity
VAGSEIGPDYDAVLRMQLNECITGNDDDVMLLNETYFQSQLVRVGVRSL